nr:metallophosphoesterase [Methanothermus fervidus]
MDKTIIHLSDIHFGDKTFSSELKRNLTSGIENINPDIIVVAGDVTTNGYKYEYELASEFIEELNDIADTYVVPGNHDARNVGLVHFEKLIGHRKFLHIDKSGEFAIIGLDSSQPDIDDGQIGIDQMEWAHDKLKRIPNGFIKIVTFHHHLLPIPQTGRERNILLDCGDVLKLLIDCGVDFVLNGHKHVPNVWMIEKMATINSGTATTRRLRGESFPSYNELTITDEKIHVNLINTENNVKKTIAQYGISKEEEAEIVYYY